MIKAIISDVSYVILFPKDKKYSGLLNSLYEQKKIEKDFNLFNYFELNTELMDFYKSIKNKAKLVIYTSDFIQEDVAIKGYLDEVFDKIYSARRMNTHKSKMKGYQQIISELNIPAEEILFIDDDETNIKIAREVGLITLQYENNLELFNKLKYLLT